MLVRDAGRLERYLRQPKDGRVPCGDCAACCYHPRIDVAPDERHPSLKLATDGTSLRKRADGSCIHLIGGRCEVYERRPSGCRLFDCRVHSALGITTEFDGGQKPPEWRFIRNTSIERRFTEAGRRLAAQRSWQSLDELVEAAAREARGGH